MTETYLNLNNFNYFEALLSLFPASKDYEFTAKKIFRFKKLVICREQECWHDGHDFIRKKRFGKVKVGKQICKVCTKQYHEDKGFWKKLLRQWRETITSLILTLRDSHVAWEVVQKIWGKKVIHQKCLLHLNKLAVKKLENERRREGKNHSQNG